MLAPTQIPVSTLWAVTAAAAICAPRGVVSGLISSSTASSTGDTASTGRPALRRKRSRPVTEPKYGGRGLSDHSAVGGARCHEEQQGDQPSPPPPPGGNPAATSAPRRSLRRARTESRRPPPR